MEQTYQIYGRINKPVAEVFDAVYNPEKLSLYFTTGGASAPLIEGTEVTWDFADFPGKFPVQVKTVVQNEKIVLGWDAKDDGSETPIQFLFNAENDGWTRIEISEFGWGPEAESLKAAFGTCFGWTQMMCCLKVYLEYGIILRTGFFK